MKHRLRLILTFLLHGPAVIGDVNLRYVPMPLVLLWFGFMKLWYCVPVVSRRSRFEELKQEAEGSKYWIKYMQQARAEAREADALANEYEYELRKLEKFDIVLDVKRRVADKDTYEYPQRTYDTDYSKESRFVVSTPVMKAWRTEE